MKMFTVLLSLIVFILGLVAAGLFHVSKLANEPYPYERVDLLVGPVAISKTVPVQVSIARTKLCAYEIEWLVYDADRQKWDATDSFATPLKLVDEFKAPVTVDFDPVNGPAEYNVRIGSKCNWVQRIWPNFGPWYTEGFFFQIPD